MNAIIFQLYEYEISLYICNIIVSDLQDPNINGWTVSNKGIINSYQTTILQCNNQNLLLLNTLPNIYSKTFNITDQKYDQLYLEMDLYFMAFSFFTKVYNQLYVQNSICGSSDSYYTIHQKFYSQQAELNLEIQFIASSSSSQLGVTNLNIYTNGYRLSNGCNLDKPFLQGTECVEYCTVINAYLGGDDMLVQSDWKISCGLIICMGILQYITISRGSLIFDKYLFTNRQYLQLQQCKNHVFRFIYTIIFNYITIILYYLVNQSTHTLKITFLFYILGDWDDGSQVQLQIIGNSIYPNNTIKIFKEMGKYQSSTGREFFYTKIQLQNGNIITVRRTLIIYQANFYSSYVKIGFSQQLLGSTATYGFGNLYIYELLNDPKIVLSGLYGIPYKCIANYYAYNGYCRLTCPPYTFQDQVNNNCTDLTSTQSQIFDNTITQNYYGTYIVKEFYDNNFDWDNVRNLFKVILYPTYNYLNGQPFSFVGNKKILGGYGVHMHSQIRIQFNLYLIDNWQSADTFTYYLDDIFISTYSQSSPNIQLQGLSNLDQKIFVNKKYIHTQQTLKLLFNCNIQQKNSMLASCGISDLFILVDQKIDVICPSRTQYFSYFTNNCENCTISGCKLYQDLVLVKCSIGCLDCSNSSICNQCDSNIGYYSDLDKCSCIPGYIKQNTCNKCHYSCLTCGGTLNNQCSTCDQTRIFSQGVCQCQNGKFDVFSQSSCQTINSSPSYCHYSCATCFSTQYYNCLNCPGGSYRAYSNYYTCPCNSQYVDVGVYICSLITCDVTCLTCDGPQESDCLSCSPNFRLYSGYCICDGQYNNISSSSSCVLNSNTCDLTCLTCFGMTSLECISCDTNQHRFLDVDYATNLYKCTCYDGYFEESQICQQCNPACLTCSSLLSCITCDMVQFRVITASSNQCICIAGYNDQLNPGQQCVQNYPICHYSCQECFGSQSNQCLSCDPTYRVLNNTTCDCLPQQFEVGWTTKCCCDQSCLTCNGISINNCLTCDISLNRILESNQCNCITGYNNKLNIYSCEQDIIICDFNCLTCYGLQQNQCLTCPSDRILQDTSCICHQGYYQRYPACFLCHYSCLNCSGSGLSNCIECDVQNFRSIKINSCLCQSGYVDVGVSMCQVCPIDCLNCDTQLNCISCKLENKIVSKYGRCGCSEKYYFQNGKCVQCHQSCKQCFGSLDSQCTQCDPFHFRRLIDSNCQCQDGYQENSNGQCIDCKSEQGKVLPSCQYSNPTDGVWTYGEKCDDGNYIPRDGCTRYIIDMGYQCDNQFEQRSICYKCPSNCQKCQLNNKLIQCQNCLTNYFNSQNVCNKCQDDNCQICNSYSNCIKCLQEVVPQNGKCQLCELGYEYKDRECISICGDGIKTKEEQCDDHNIFNNDGCNQRCDIEQGFICNPVCELEQNVIQAKIQKSGEQINNIIIEIINYELDLNKLDVVIDYFDKDKDFNFNKSLISSQKFEIQFTFYKPIKSFNIIHVYIPLKSKQRLLDYQIREIQLIPSDLDYYDDEQKTQKQSIQNTQIGPITMLLGGASFFLQLLDIISWINNFYYINVNYPGNVQIFFENANWGLIIDLPQIYKFQINDNDQQIPQKFQDKGVDGLFINNTQQIIIMLTILLIIIPLSKRLLQILKLHLSGNEFNNQALKSNSKFPSSMLKVSSQLLREQQPLEQEQQKQVKQQIKSQLQIQQIQESQQMEQPKTYIKKWLSNLYNLLLQFYNDRQIIIIQIINLSILDIALSIMVNIKYVYYFKELILIVSFIFCILFSILILSFFYFLIFIVESHKIMMKLKWFRNLAYQLFEVLKQDKISRFYGFQAIFQKTLFIIFQVAFYERPIQQTLFCSFILSGQLLIFIFQYPFKSFKDFISQFIPDLSLLLILLLSILLAADEQIRFFTNYQRYNLGWVMLGIICLSIIIQLLFIINQAYESMLMKIKWIKSLIRQ